MPVVYKGPAQIEFGALKFQHTGDVVVEDVSETFEIDVDAFQTVDERLRSLLYTVRFTPSGQYAGEALDLIIAAAARSVGASILGSTLVVKPYLSPQKVLTFARAGVTGLPVLRLGASQTLYGEITFTCLTTADTLWSAEAAFPTPSTYSAPTSTFDYNSVFTTPWKGVWSATPASPTEGAPWASFDTEEGFEISCDLETSPSRVDRYGIVDYTHVDFRMTVTCNPVGITEEDIITAKARTGTVVSAPGMSLHPILSGAVTPRSLRFESVLGAKKLQMDYAAMKTGQFVYGARNNRTQGLQFVSMRKFSSGAPQPIFTDVS